MRPSLYILVIALVAAACPPTTADTVILRDGRKIAGQIVVQGDMAVVAVETPYGRLEFKSSEVERLDYDRAQPGSDSAGRSGGPTSPITLPGGSAHPGATPSAAPAVPPPASQPDPEAATLSMADRDLYMRATGEADKVVTAAEGLAVWKQFLADHPGGALADIARKRIVQWQGRVDKDQVRFGPTWLGRAEVTRRNALADEKLAAAGKSNDLDEAGKLYDEAIAANPYRSEIAFAKAARMAKGGRIAAAVAAFDQVLTVSPDSAAARNDMGVLMAQQKIWARALVHLSKAAALLDSDVALDNLDLVGVLIRQAGPGDVDASAADRAVRQVVADRHKAGKNVGQSRWGNSWVAKTDLDKMGIDAVTMQTQYDAAVTRKANMERDLVIVEQNLNYLRGQLNKLFQPGEDSPAYRKMAATVATGQDQEKTLRDNIAQAKKDIDALLAKRKDPPHADRLVMLDRDGKTELMSFPVAAPDTKAAAAGN